MRVGLVSCAKLKASGPVPARELYAPSQLFRAARDYAETHYDRWFILSALHGLLDPERITAPYNVTLLNMSRGQREHWGKRVRQHIRVLALEGETFYVHAGRMYADALDLDGWRIPAEYPVRGLQIGQQLVWYAERRREPQAVLL